MRAPFLHSGPSVPFHYPVVVLRLLCCVITTEYTIIEMGMCLLSWPRQCPLVVGASVCVNVKFSGIFKQNTPEIIIIYENLL